MRKKAKPAAMYRCMIGMLSIVRSQPNGPLGTFHISLNCSIRLSAGRSATVAMHALRLLQALEVRNQRMQVIRAHIDERHLVSGLYPLCVDHPRGQIAAGIAQRARREHLS